MDRETADWISKATGEPVALPEELALLPSTSRIRRTKMGKVVSAKNDRRKRQPLQLARGEIPSFKNMPRMISDGLLNAVLVVEEVPGVPLRVELFWFQNASHPLWVLEESIRESGNAIQPPGSVDTGGKDIVVYYRVEAGASPRGHMAAHAHLQSGSENIKAMLYCNQQMFSFAVLQLRERPRDKSTGRLQISDVRLMFEADSEELPAHKNTRVAAVKREALRERKELGLPRGLKRLRSEADLQKAWV